MITIRPARPTDQEHLGRYGVALMHQHHESDPKRFIEAMNAEGGYGRFLVSQIATPTNVVLVAESDGAVVGYLWANIESTSWMLLRGPCGVIQDVYVDPAARRLGAGRALMRAGIEWIRSKGRTQIVLMTKTKNEHAQRLFAALGFRPTMMEMTLDVEGTGDHG